MSEKKRVLIVYESLNIGGSTTSLINLLRGFDSERYELDLIRYRRSPSECADMLPGWVRTLDDAAKHGKTSPAVAVKALKLAFSPSFYRAMLAKRRGASKYAVQQHMAYARLRLSRKTEGRYDAVIGYLEGWSNAYALSRLVRAERRIVFIHHDYASAGDVPDIDRRAFAGASAIVTVSESCRKRFSAVFPELSGRVHVIENVFDPPAVRASADGTALPDGIGHFDILTVCRADIYVKGLDRLLSVAEKLRKNGYRFRWGLLGVSDSGDFHRLYLRYGLDGYVVPLGEVSSPYPFFRRASILAVTSRHEARPMVVTEAQILGLPCIVTDYSSAREQVRDGVDGLVVENSEEGIYSGICRVLEHPELIEGFADGLKDRCFDGSASYATLYSLIDGETGDGAARSQI